MDTLNEFLDFLNDYEMGVIEICLQNPENKLRAKQETPNELAHTILVTLSWHYKGLWSNEGLPYNRGERSEQLWDKAKELGIIKD